MTVNGVANTILRHTAVGTLTIQNTQSAGNQTMSVILGNATANVVSLENTGNLVISSIVTGSAGGLTVNGTSTGRLILGGANTYSGGTTVNSGGILQVGDAGTAGTLGTGAVVNNGTLTFSRSDSVSVSNTISGIGTLNFAGPGPGVTTLTGTLDPGNSGLGTMTATGTVNLGSGGTFRAELGAGTTSDRLNMSGGAHTLNLNNGSTVNLVASGFTRTGTPATFTLADLRTGASLLQLNGVGLAAGPTGTDITKFTADGAGGGSFSTINGSVNLTATGFGSLLAGDTLTLRRSAGGDLVVVFTPVPEPGTLLGVCALAVGGVTAVRRWRKRAATPAAAV